MSDFWTGAADARRDFATSRGALDDILAVPPARRSEWERGYVDAAQARGLVASPTASRQWPSGPWAATPRWTRFDALAREAKPAGRPGHALPASVRALLVPPRPKG